MHRGHHREGQALDRVEQAPILFFLRRAGELADVGAREERAALAAQDERRGPADVLERIEESCAHRSVDRVDRRVVDREDADLALLGVGGDGVQFDGLVHFSFRSLAAFSFMMSGRTSGLIGSFSNSASQRSGWMTGLSVPKSTLSFSSVLA